jgi:hypothetical protein
MLEMNRGREASKLVAEALLAHPENPELLNTSGLMQMAAMHLPQAEAKRPHPPAPDNSDDRTIASLLHSSPPSTTLRHKST